jgi:CMP-N-acetylneuraminic acid synthetase
MYRANGAIYIASLQQIQDSHSLISKDSIAYEMSSSDSLDVDTEHDLVAVEEVLTQRSASQTSL